MSADPTMADGRRRLLAALDEAGIGHRDEGGLLRLALGEGDDFVDTFSLASAGDEVRWTATLVTAPIVADRDRDRLTHLLRATPLDYRLQHAGGRTNAIAARSLLAAPGGDLATVRAARQAFDQLRDTLRFVEGTLFKLRPEMAGLDEAGRHELAGRLPDAIAAARRGLDRLRRSADTRTRATHQVTLGGLLYATGHDDEAAPLLADGLPALAAEDPWMGAIAELAIAQTDDIRNRVEPALVRCTRAVDVLSRVGSEQTQVVAGTHLARSLLRVGRPDDARRTLRQLEIRIDTPTWPGPLRLLGDVRALMATTFDEIGDRSSAQDYLDAARTAYRAAGVDDAAAATELVGDRARGLRELPWNEMWQASTRGLDPSAAVGPAVPPASATAPADPALDGIDEAMRRGDLGALLDGLERFASSQVVPGASPEADHAMEILPLLRHLLDLRTPDLDSSAERQQAIQAISPRLLDWALGQLRVVDRQLQLESVADRERWMQQIGRTLVIAVMAAITSGKFGIAHLLIERARAQGMPDVEASFDRIMQLVPPALASAGAPIGDDPVDDPDERSEEQLRLDGVRALLADLSVRPVQLGDPGAETTLVGGDGAWRWTLWRAGDLLFWSLLEPNPDGGWTTWAGFVLLAPVHPAAAGIPDDTMRAMFDGSLGEMLTRLRRAYGVDAAGQDLPEAEVVSGELLEDVQDREPALASHLGRGLLPAMLRMELRRRFHAGEPPVPLVIAPAATLADVPYGLLGIDSPTPDRPFGVRLLEAAVVTMAPPSVLVSGPPAGDVPAGGLEVPLAVVAPTADLDACRAMLDALPADVRERSTVLGTVAAPGLEPDGAATRDTVVQALRELPAGAPGVLIWAGHAEPGDDRRPMEARLKLAGAGAGASDRGLSVGDLVLGDLHVPSRVVLFACSSVGAVHREQTHVSSDIVEWWGFPVALMCAGASAVAATGWRVFDTPAGVAVAADLAAQARTAPDLATALRDLQLEHLRAWERQRLRDRTFTGRVGEHHPHLWAAWTVVGLAGG